MIENKRILRLLAFVTVCALLTALAGCAGGKGAVPAAPVQVVSGEITERTSAVQDKSLHLIDPDALGTPMASSGLMQLFLDDNSFGIALYEKTREKYWYALPTAPSAGYDYSAATLTLDVLYGNTLYKLNSQDDCMRYRNVACDTLGDDTLSGFYVTYVLTPDAATARKISSDKIFENTIKATDFARTDVAFLVRVTYELRDGNLYVGAEWKNLSENPDAIVCDLSLLPFFGASDAGQKGDYFLLPDGCGALMHTDVRDPSFTPIDLRVYGDDPCASSQTQVYPALYPAFAEKQGDNAFVVILEQGDALATIHAERASGAHGFNTVGAHFAITDTFAGQKNGKDVTYVSKTSYTDPVRLCVRLLGGANAGPEGLAAACREQFMRMGYLSTDTVQSEEYLPFQLDLYGAASGSRLGFPQVLTSFDEARDLLARMKSKGVNNIDIRYLGALRGGTNGADAGRVQLAMRMGGKKGLQKLAEFSTAQGHSLYLDASVLTCRTQGTLSGSAALNIESESASYERDIGERVYERRLLRMSALEKNVIRLLTDARQIAADGFCVQDAASILYSDYAQGYVSREQAMQTVRENMPALSTDRLLMVDTGYFYGVRYADYICALPQTTGVPERKALYTAIPFAQMILHGTLDYSGTPVNLAEDGVQAQLRAIEFGCCPRYAWCFSRSGGARLCYEEQLNDAVGFYLQANDALADLRDARIVDNGDAAAGVRFTRYDNGAVIYVNYTEKQVDVGNFRVDALSFLRIG